MKKIEFGLTKGMAEEEILKELKGRVSGETRQELQQFYTTRKLEGIPMRSYEVILEDEIMGYALLVKRDIWKDRFGVVNLANHYYLSGITDEGKYFLHELNVQDPSMPMTMEAIVNWVNRSDEGYSRRIQGDILIQYLAKTSANFVRESDKVSSDGTHPVQYNAPGANGAMRQQSTHYATKSTEIQLGNHRVSVVKGFIIGNSWNSIIVDAEELLIQHPEHEMVREKIPEGHYVVLVGQRGRNQVGSGVGFD